MTSVNKCSFLLWDVVFLFRPISVVSNGVSWCVGITISRRSLWMILCWRVSLAASPETFCACGGVWPPNSQPPPQARTLPIKVPVACSTPSVSLRDSVVQDPQQVIRTNTHHYPFMRLRSCGSSGTARSLTCPVLFLRNLSLPVSFDLFLYCYLFYRYLFCSADNRSKCVL